MLRSFPGKKGVMNNKATKWRALSGEEDWKGLLDPLDLDLRRYIIHYGERVQAIYDAFIGEEKSKNCGLPRYAKRHLFSKVGLGRGNPYNYEVKGYFYATADISNSRGFFKKSISPEAVAGDSNWIGYVAVTTDVGTAVLGRRDILVCWRGTLGVEEWVINMKFDMAPASPIFGKKHDPKVHHGWYSMYTAACAGSTYNSASCREQVLSEVSKLIETYKEEEVSITVTGHSLGAALATLNGVDIALNLKPCTAGTGTDEPIKACLVTVFVFGGPRVGDKGFLEVFTDLKNLRVLRVNNKPGDVIPSLPPSMPLLFPYVDVGKELIIDTRKSPYLKKPLLDSNAHNLEVYLHGVAGTQGECGEFKLEVSREIALVNKMSDALKDEFLVFDYWWTTGNKSMAQNDDGSWVLIDQESDDNRTVIPKQKTVLL